MTDEDMGIERGYESDTDEGIESDEGSDQNKDRQNASERLIFGDMKMEDYYRGAEVANSEGANTRKVVIARRHSPAVGDPTLLPPMSEHGMSQEDANSLAKYNIKIGKLTPKLRGQFSEIYECHASTGKHRISRIALKRSWAFRQAWAETEAMQVLGKERAHRNLVNYIGTYHIGLYLYIAMEWADMGDLAHFLNENFGDEHPLTEDYMRDLFRDIHPGLEHMHVNGFAHRDVKINNILIFTGYDKSPERKPVEYVPKICDFGSSRRYGNDETRRSTTVIGCPKCMAPEIYDTPYDPFVADIYSLGIILFLMANNGEYPFNLPEPTTVEETVNTVKGYARLKRENNIKWSPKTSAGLRELLSQMLEPDPSKRITLEMIRQNEWYLLPIKHEKE